MKASVVIATYNYAQYIGDALTSILNQDYDQSLIEVIVVDDGSSDNTEEVVLKYKERFQSLSYYKTENEGKAAATYLGFKYATGDVVFALDADDSFMQTKISKVISVFRENSDVFHVGHTALVVDENAGSSSVENIPTDICDRLISGNNLISYFLTKNCLWGGGSTFSVRKHFDFLPENTKLCDMYIDEFLVYRALSLGKSYLIKEPLSIWRVHGSNYSVGDRFKLEKVQRLEKSARGMLAIFKSINFLFVDIYQFKYLIAKAYQAQLSNKNINWLYRISVLFFFFFMLLYTRPRTSVKLLKAYEVPNRLLLPSLYLYLKKRSR